MENKIYFKVHDRIRENCGYGTYSHKVLNTSFYKENEIEKALKHYKKRKANNICMCRVEYLDDVPYAEVTHCFGDEKYITDENGVMKKYIVFDRNGLDMKFEL